MVDVNVHPTKREVRITSEHQIYEWLYHTVKNTLKREAPSLAWPVTGELSTSTAAETTSLKIFGQTISDRVAGKTVSDGWPGLPTGRWQYLGQIFYQYILATDDQNIYIIDQHAAQEAIFYEQFLSEWKKGVVSQPLLITLTKNYSSASAQRIKNNLTYLNELGWQIEEFGPGSFRCLAQPQIFPPVAAEVILDDILAEIAETEFITDDTAVKRLKEKIARKACHRAIRALDTLGIPEIRKLLLELEKRPDLVSCPHGRPIVIIIGKTELDKKFQRT
jgi:DNA mismatch repair protein MutL